MMEEGGERMQATYRGEYKRLVTDKRKYGRVNLFQVTQNIPPASCEVALRARASAADTRGKDCDQPCSERDGARVQELACADQAKRHPPQPGASLGECEQRAKRGVRGMKQGWVGDEVERGAAQADTESHCSRRFPIGLDPDKVR
jgi:hypothetical protein